MKKFIKMRESVLDKRF